MNDEQLLMINLMGVGNQEYKSKKKLMLCAS
jgi:hypothetical protein